MLSTRTPNYAESLSFRRNQIAINENNQISNKLHESSNGKLSMAQYRSAQYRKKNRNHKKQMQSRASVRFKENSQAKSPFSYVTVARNNETMMFNNKYNIDYDNTLEDLYEIIEKTE